MLPGMVLAHTSQHLPDHVQVWFEDHSQFPGGNIYTYTHIYVYEDALLGGKRGLLAWL